eukprot:11045499-Alexandrium_andersonii.AAC.1
MATHARRRTAGPQRHIQEQVGPGYSLSMAGTGLREEPAKLRKNSWNTRATVSYTHLRAHETSAHL